MTENEERELSETLSKCRRVYIYLYLLQTVDEEKFLKVCLKPKQCALLTNSLRASKVGIWIKAFC